MPVMINFENFFSSWPTWPSAVVVWRLRESASCLSGSSFSMTDDRSTEISLMRVLLVLPSVLSPTATEPRIISPGYEPRRDLG